MVSLFRIYSYLSIIILVQYICSSSCFKYIFVSDKVSYDRNLVMKKAFLNFVFRQLCYYYYFDGIK
jgi:hypothetical protein